MDIWGWVHTRSEVLYEEGHHELANYIGQIPSYAVDDEFDKVDQVYHAAIPLCRALEDKWLEIYFRHWRLQAHVLKNYDAKGLLPEAISLLDYTHSEDTKECPQRICAVQDLAACYGIKDGPGYAEERISVCKETLAQIDGSWPCYQCVGGELLDAYIDSEQFEHAELEITAMETELSKYNENENSALALIQTRLHIKLGELNKAWTVIENADAPLGGDGFKREQVLLKTLVLCHLERWDEAQAIAPSFEIALQAAKYFSDWTQIQYLFYKKGLVKNDRNLRYRFHHLADKLLSKDSLRRAFTIYERLIELCLASNETLRANFALDQMRLLSPQFNRDLGAQEKIDSLAPQIDSIKPPKTAPVFTTVEALLEYEFSNETEEFQSVEKGLESWPSETKLITRKSTILQNCFKHDNAFDVLSKAYEQYRGSSALENHYGQACLARLGFEKYTNQFPMDNLEGLSKGAIWNRGFNYVAHYEDKAPLQALHYIKIIEEYWPEDIWLMGRIARLHIQNKNFDEAESYRRKQIELDPETDNHKWDVLIAATLNNNIPLICEMAESLKIEVDDTGRYAGDNQISMRLQCDMPFMTIDHYNAVRLGPALARLTTVSNHQEDKQVYGRHVVFDPAPINRLDQKDKEGYACDKDGYYNLLYPVPLHTLSDPQYKTYTIDGVHPGEDNLQLLSDKISDAGFIYQLRSSENYTLIWNIDEDVKNALAIYIYVLIEDGQQERLSEILTAFSNTLEHPLIWLELATALNDTALLTQQMKIKDTYNIE